MTARLSLATFSVTNVIHEDLHKVSSRGKLFIEPIALEAPCYAAGQIADDMPRKVTNANHVPL